MTYAQLRRLVQVNSDTILESLTRRQFVHPHRTVAEVVSDTQQEFGGQEDSGEKVLHRLSLDPSRAIGRLRRCEMNQLARVLYRQWRNADESEQ